MDYRFCHDTPYFPLTPGTAGDGDRADLNHVARGREPDRQCPPLLGRPAVVGDDGGLDLVGPVTCCAREP